MARLVLEGVGDATRGEWLEGSMGVELGTVHLRRRLSAMEDRLVGPVVDVRATNDARRRFSRVIQRVPWVADLARKEARI